MAAVTMPTAATPEFSTLVVVDEQSEIGAARRAAVALGAMHGLDTKALGRLALVVTEAATNVVRHASGGIIIFRALSDSATIEMLALDKGPGIANVERALQDGFSTAGTAGMGLGAVRRMADVFAIHSQPESGTALLARVGHAAASRADGSLPESLDDRLGVVCVPLRGENLCGDAWRVSGSRRAGSLSLMVVDGLGHGAGAADAAAAATAVFSNVDHATPTHALGRMDEATRGTRGAALSFATVNDETRTAHFSGVGNVEGRVLGKDSATVMHLVPQNGIVGHTMPTLRPLSAPWPAGARLVMHSDGISGRWRLDAYPGLMAAHPALMAGIIFRDFARQRDDATVLVLADGPAAERR